MSLLVSPLLSPAASCSAASLPLQQAQLSQLKAAWSILWPTTTVSATSAQIGPRDMRIPSSMRVDGNANAEVPLSITTRSPTTPELTKVPRCPRGLGDLPSELWQHLVLYLPASTLWHSRLVHPHWQTFIERHFSLSLLHETRLILQVDTRPSFDFLGTFPLGRVEGRWVEYDLPQGEGRRWWAPIERARLAKDGRHLLLGGKAYAMQVSISGYLGPAPTARRVEYDERKRVVRVDWRVLFCEMFAVPGYWPRDLRLEELMHVRGEGGRKSMSTRGHSG